VTNLYGIVEWVEDSIIDSQHMKVVQNRVYFIVLFEKSQVSKKHIAVKFEES
jgi:hypothetical protein